jgi:hypothetical protein
MASNAMDGSGRGTPVLVVTAIMMVLATLFVVLRMISRIGIVRRVALDDYFMVLAWVRAAKLKCLVANDNS